MEWPEHGSICVDCRTAHEAHASTCEASPRHRVRSMHNPEHREELLTEVWGPPSARRRARALATASGLGVSGSAAANGCADCTAAAVGLGELGVFLAVAAVFALLYWLCKKLCELVQRRRHGLMPHGALHAAPRLGPRSGRVGVVERAAARPAPITGEACVAYGVAFRCKRFLRDPVMLRDAATIGFDVRLDSGERVRIPPGRVLLDMRGAVQVPVEPGREEGALGAYLARVDPGRCTAAHEPDHDPVPRERIDLQLIRPGARVEVRGVLVPAADPGAAGDYRTGATILVPRGVPRLSLV